MKQNLNIFRYGGFQKKRPAGGQAKGYETTYAKQTMNKPMKKKPINKKLKKKQTKNTMNKQMCERRSMKATYGKAYEQTYENKHV